MLSPNTHHVPAWSKRFLFLEKTTPSKWGRIITTSTKIPSLLVYAQLFAPSRIQHVRVFWEGLERTREFLVLLRVLNRIGAGRPAFVRLTQRNRAGSRGVDVAVRTATCGIDHVAVAEVFEEAWQTQRVHTAGDDRGSRLHAQPLLMVVRTIGRIALDHISDVAVIMTAFHLAVAHRADVNAGSTLQTGELRQHERGVTTHCRRRSDHAVTRAVIMQILLRILKTCSGCLL